MLAWMFNHRRSCLFFFLRQLSLHPSPEMSLTLGLSRDLTTEHGQAYIFIGITSLLPIIEGLPRPLQIVGSYLQHDFQNVLIIQDCFTENIWVSKTEKSNI